ncbi:MAG: tRNA dihydrouridine synthase DusB [Anaerolineae bacterium]|nr:tRNA dihydrouridine synthase DusB [Anaerolineae bacterium]
MLNTENTTNQEPVFKIGHIPVYGEIILAPMAGFTDRPYRQICREYGAALCYTEMAHTDSLLYAARRAMHILDFAPDETPRMTQLLGADVDKLVESAHRLVEMGVDSIDLNMGCSVPKVVNRGAGANLLTQPQKIAEIFTRLNRELTIPITGKIRLGWNAESHNYLEIAHILEDSGAVTITVHGRNREQRYDEPADWDAIAEVKQAVSIPVVGNGDVLTWEDVGRMRAYTGCDAVMVGRAALGNPWFFQGRNRDAVSLEERVMVMERHLRMMEAFYGENQGVKRFRKHLTRYLKEKVYKDLNQELLRYKRAQDIINRLYEYLANAVDLAVHSEH